MEQITSEYIVERSPANSCHYTAFCCCYCTIDEIKEKLQHFDKKCPYLKLMHWVWMHLHDVRENEMAVRDAVF